MSKTTNTKLKCSGGCGRSIELQLGLILWFHSYGNNLDRKDSYCADCWIKKKLRNTGHSPGKQPRSRTKSGSWKKKRK